MDPGVYTITCDGSVGPCSFVYQANESKNLDFEVTISNYMEDIGNICFGYMT